MLDICDLRAFFSAETATAPTVRIRHSGRPRRFGFCSLAHRLRCPCHTSRDRGNSLFSLKTSGSSWATHSGNGKRSRGERVGLQRGGLPYGRVEMQGAVHVVDGLCQRKGARDENSKPGFFQFSFGELFDKGISMGSGQAPVKKYRDTTGAIVNGRAKPSRIVSHRVRIDEAPKGVREV